METFSDVMEKCSVMSWEHLFDGTPKILHAVYHEASPWTLGPLDPSAGCQICQSSASQSLFVGPLDPSTLDPSTLDPSTLESATLGLGRQAGRQTGR